MNPRHVQQIRRRLDALRWFRDTMAEYPGGFVPVPTAARILGVTPARIRNLAKEGRIRMIQGMPGGIRRDKFVPLDDLVSAPFEAERGLPGRYGKKNRVGPVASDGRKYRA